MVDAPCRRAFAEDMVFLRTCGILPVVVHGGGPQVTAMLDRLGVPSEFRGGLRVTTEETIDVVRMVLTGQVGPDASGRVHNLNADTAAAALAVALGAVKLVVLTDVEGLYADWPDRESLVQKIDTRELAEILPSLDSGMVPKMAACLRAVEGGVKRATVVDGRTPHALLLEMFTTEGTGTMVVPADTGEE